MKRNRLFLVLGLTLSLGFLSSCKEEANVRPDSDGVPDGTLSVNYAVQVVPVGDVDKGLDGATVTLQTQNGVTTKTVGPDGIAVFENIGAGKVSGYVSMQGFASVNFSAQVDKTNVDANTNDYVQSTVYIPARNSSLQGRIYGDWDLDGNTLLSDAGNFQAVNVYVKYGLGGYPMGAGNGMLTSVSLDTYTYGITTGANGDFTLANLPNTDMGYFIASYSIEDVLLVDAVSGSQIIFNIGSNGVSLAPGEVRRVGDIMAN